MNLMYLANDQFRVRIYSQWQIAAADSAANYQGSIPGDVKSAARVRPGQRTRSANYGRAISQTNLAAMRMAGEGHGIFVIAK